MKAFQKLKIGRPIESQREIQMIGHKPDNNESLSKHRNPSVPSLKNFVFWKL
jgi:hypothetical protein